MRTKAKRKELTQELSVSRDTATEVYRITFWALAALAVIVGAVSFAALAMGIGKVLALMIGV